MTETTSTNYARTSVPLLALAIATCLISLIGAFLQIVIAVMGGFQQGRALFGALVLTAAVLTLLLGAGGGLEAMRGNRTGRVLVAVCCLYYLGNGIITLLSGNIGSLVQLAVAIPLGVLWWLPATTRAMRTERTRRDDRARALAHAW